MTIRNLLNFFEEYYGEKYTGIFLEVMREYLKRFTENELDAISNVIVKNFPRHFNKSPDPAVIGENIHLVNLEWRKRCNMKRDMGDETVLYLKKILVYLHEMLSEEPAPKECVITEILEIKQRLDKLLRAADENPDYKFKYGDIQLFHKMDAFFNRQKPKEGETK